MDIQVESASDQNVEADVLFMSIGEGAIVTDANARISRVNDIALGILGFKREELIGKWFPEAILAESEDKKKLSNLERPISHVFLNGQAVSARVYYRRKDGSRVPVFLTASPVMVGGKPVGAIEVFRDITDELALEKAKDEFVAIASHQLRTPATAVKQYVGLLLEGYAEPLAENQKIFLEKAYESNERQLQIVHEILKVTQLDLEKVVLKLDLYDLRKIVREAAGGLEGLMSGRRQKLVIDEPEHEVLSNVDAGQIRIAVENLLENASNYSWEGRDIKVIIEENKDNTKITIKDAGVGIKKQDIAKLFQKFSRVHNELSVEAGGTGLGLYWASKIIELHGGRIEVKSEPSKGSEFIIILPRSY